MRELPSPTIKFTDMSIGEKLVFFVKLGVFCVTFGFAFPRIMSD